MKAETLLPLGKLDPGLRAPDTPLNIADFGPGAALVERIGYDAVLVEETKDDPYQLMALAAAATRTIGLGTSVAMAFPRSPTVTAMSAWSLQKLSEGRFTLGLGSQVRGHVRRRFGMEWHPPAPWMRDYIQAMRAVWNTWQTGEQLSFESDHYNLSLMVPLFDPGPIDHPEIPVHIAAIGPNMVAVAGEVADGVRLHPVCTPKFITEQVHPSVARGAARAGRDRDEVEVCLKPLIGAARDEAKLAEAAEIVRARAAFYLSTPAYRRAWEIHDWGDQADQAAALSKAQQWDDLVKVVDDEMLHTVATLGTYDTIGAEISRRYEGLVDRIEFSIPVQNDEDAEILSGILGEIRTS